MRGRLPGGDRRGKGSCVVGLGKSRLGPRPYSELRTPKAFARHGRHGDQDGQAERAFKLPMIRKITRFSGRFIGPAGEVAQWSGQAENKLELTVELTGAP